MTRKTISLPDEMADWIETRLSSGQYNNESEYFRDLVRQDRDDQEKLAFLRAALDESDRQIARGAYAELRTRKDIQQFLRGVARDVDAEGKLKSSKQKSSSKRRSS